MLLLYLIICYICCASAGSTPKMVPIPVPIPIPVHHHYHHPVMMSNSGYSWQEPQAPSVWPEQSYQETQDAGYFDRGFNDYKMYPTRTWSYHIHPNRIYNDKFGPSKRIKHIPTILAGTLREGPIPSQKSVQHEDEKWK